ncbi:hypothetical protein [Sedimenticola selenatireducens]|uniref:hypothetical protein n=1 Tax=Sedimenticola selenatireducens TaxID=191960 RepID=UPI003F4ADFEB
MKLKRVLSITLVVGLVAYAALKGAVYYQVKTGLGRLTAMVAPFATLKYEAIESALQGSVAVTGISVMPADAPVGTRIERIELQGEGTRFLLDLLKGFDAERPPRRLQLSVSRMAMPLGGGYLQQWFPASSATEPDICTLGGLLGQTQIERLGFRQRLADTRLRYDFDRRSGEMTLLMDYTLDGLAALSVEMSLNKLSPMDAGATPVLERFSLHYRIDPDYMRRTVDYCAGEAGLDSAAFIDRLFTGGSTYYANNLGFIPGEGLRSALRRLISRPGDLLITSVPDSQFSPALLQQYKPQELVRLLGLSLSVNDQPVTDLSFSLPQGNEQLADLFGTLAPAASGENGGGETVPAPASPKPRARFMATPVARLSRYIGGDVRVYGSERDDPQQGILMSLRDRQLELEQRLYGGKMTLYIPLEKISRVEVLRWEQPETGEAVR